MIGYKAFYKGLKPVISYFSDSIDYEDTVD